MIVVDVGEKRSSIPRLLEKLEVEFEFDHLPVGDYVVEWVAVERKTVNDYLSSKESGHLDKQLYELSRNFKLSYLVIEGFVSEALMYRRLPRYAYLSSLVGSSLKRSPDGEQGQIVTVNLDSEYDTAMFLKALDDKIRRGDYVRLPKIEKASFKPSDWAVYVLSSLPGVGEARAKALLKRFGSLRAVFSASPPDLSKVEGIGRKTADSLYKLFNTVFDPQKEGDG